MTASSAPDQADNNGLVIHKFGGSSMANADCLRQVASIFATGLETQQVLVVSAMRGVTDKLLSLVARAENGDDSWQDGLREILVRHNEAAVELLGDKAATYTNWLAERADLAREVLGAVAQLRAGDGAARDFIQGLGEVWSSRLLVECLRDKGHDVAWLDAREVLRIYDGTLMTGIDWEASAEQLRQWRASHSERHAVATGFVAGDAHGRTRVLGRNGSDYSAAIFARLFEATRLTLWGDTDGVLSADPRLVPEAVTLPTLSYNEAYELAYFGAHVVHPQTMTPAIARGLPIHIRNTFAPDHEGTVIGVDTGSDTHSPVRGLSIIGGLGLVNLEGAGMIGVPGVAERTFGALADARVSITMISQGSSEHSICCVVSASQLDIAKAALRHAFAAELASGDIGGVYTQGDIAVLAAVGEGMSDRPGVAARLFGALAHSGVNARVIAQGASERNISVALKEEDAARALRAVHAGFWLSPQTVSIGVIGTGKVGSALLEQLRAGMARLREQSHLDLRVRAITNSRRMHLDDNGREIGDWRDQLEHGEELDLVRFADTVQASHLPHAVIIDCTASSAVASHYGEWLKRGIHVITPNKHAGAGPLTAYRDIRAACRQHGTRFRYEATVGAGLPVIQTLRDLIDTGDEIIAIDGILSGTLAYLFNRFDGSLPFSELLREAHSLGYTEPDPRDDLSGTDVARKLVILAREAGRELSLDDVAVESLVPSALTAVPRDDFLARVKEADDDLAARQAHAAANDCVLRYVARLDEQGARVSLQELPTSHPFAHLRLTDNIVQFTTRRYHDNPLIVQGPGAGPEVTAAGVFADLLRVVSPSGTR